MQQAKRRRRVAEELKAVLKVEATALVGVVRELFVHARRRALTNCPNFTASTAAALLA